METLNLISDAIKPFGGAVHPVKLGLYNIKSGSSPENILLMGEALKALGMTVLVYQFKDRHLPVMGVFSLGEHDGWKILI